MIVPFYTYAIGTGEILKAGSVSERFLPTYSTGSQEVVSGVLANPATQYHDLNLNALAERTAMPEPAIVDSGSAVSIAPVPRPCTLRIGADMEVVSDGSAEIFFGGSGTYTVRIESVPYLPWQITLTVGDVLLKEDGDLLLLENDLGLAV